MPLISIITTTYKHKDYIAETIESIISQTYENWELLIGDDSPDNETREVIKSYVDKYPDKIKARHHKPNKGIVDNMNFLLEQTSEKSQYVAFLEGDDLFTQDNLQKKLEVFKHYPELKLVYCNFDFINGDSEVIYKNFLQKAPFYLKNKKISKKDFFTNETIYGSYSSLMVHLETLKSEPIRNINPNDKVFTVSDWDRFFRVANKYNTYGIEESLMKYRRHEGNASGNYLKLFNDLQMQVDYYLENNVINKKLYNHKTSFIYLLKAVSYLEKKDRKKSLSCLRKSVSYNFFSNFFQKIGVFGLNLMPNCVVKKVLKMLIKR